MKCFCKLFAVCLILLKCCAVASAEPVDLRYVTWLDEIQNGLVRFVTDDAVGYMDFTGKTVIEPIYALKECDDSGWLQNFQTYNNGKTILVSDGNERFYVDDNGNRIQYHFQYTSIGNAHNDIFWAKNKTSSFSGGDESTLGYYRTDGTVVIDPTVEMFEHCQNQYWGLPRDFSNGILSFDDADYVYNTKGERVVLHVANSEVAAQALGCTHDMLGSANVKILGNIQVGQNFPNNNENEAFCKSQVLVEDVGITDAMIGQDGDVYCGTVDNDDYILTHMSDGIAYYGTKEWYGDPKEFSGQFVNGRFETVFSLQENQELWTALMMDKAKSVVFYCSGFSDGVVMCRMKRWYLNGREENYVFTLNESGAFVMTPRSDISFGNDAMTEKGFWPKYNSELCPAIEDASEKWGYIDMKGNWAIEPRYESASNYSDGYAIVTEKIKTDFQKTTVHHLIDSMGNIIVSDVGY